VKYRVTSRDSNSDSNLWAWFLRDGPRDDLVTA